MKRTCIICGSEFDSPRSARFCPDKPGCRQAFNRQERNIKSQGETIKHAIVTLLAARELANHHQLIRSTLLEVEKNILETLDEAMPDRYPPKPITARPVIVEPQRGDKLYVFDDRMPSPMTCINVVRVDGSWVEATLDGERYKTVLLSVANVFIEVVEPETDSAGRPIIAKHNPGWGTVVNPGGQTEIAAIEPDGDSDEYSDDEEDWED